MLNDKPGEFHVTTDGRLYFKPSQNWSHTIEDLAQRLADIICDSRFKPFRKNENDEDWVLDSGNNWWFHMAPADPGAVQARQGEGWYYILHRYYHREPGSNYDREKMNALGNALIWLV